MRKEQERKQQIDARFVKVRQRVSTHYMNNVHTGCDCDVCACIGEARRVPSSEEREGRRGSSKNEANTKREGELKHA